MTSNKDNPEKTIIVVGASSGFGRGSALEFAKNALFLTLIAGVGPFYLSDWVGVA